MQPTKAQSRCILAARRLPIWVHRASMFLCSCMHHAALLRPVLQSSAMDLACSKPKPSSCQVHYQECNVASLALQLKQHGQQRLSRLCAVNVKEQTSTPHELHQNLHSPKPTFIWGLLKLGKNALPMQLRSSFLPLAQCLTNVANPGTSWKGP